MSNAQQQEALVIVRLNSFRDALNGLGANLRYRLF